MERAIEFLLEHQATLEQRIEQTNAQIAKTSEQLAKTDEQLTKTDAQLAKTDAQVSETSRQLAAYAETQSEFIEITTRSIQSLVEAQTRTDERLNILIGIVERHVADGHGGQK